MTEQTIAELEKRVQARFQAVLDSRQRVLMRVPGILGRTNETGSAAISGSPGWVYVRIGNDETIATAFNNRVTNRNGLAVYVGYDPAQPTLFQVLSTREAYEGQSTSGQVLANHHIQHEWGSTTGGDDVIWVRMRQIADFLVYPTDPESLTVNVGNGVYFLNATAYKYAGGTLDLTSYVPSTTGQRWVLVALDETGPYAVAGTVASSVTWSDIPDTTDEVDFKLAAILLKNGDTAITDWPNDARIVDLRLASSRAATAATPQVVLHSTTVTYYAASDAGLALAVAAATSGDTITVPPITLTNDYSIPAGVVLVGESRRGTIFSGQVTLGANSRLETVSVVRSKNDASTYYGVAGPDWGTCTLHDCWVSVTQAGAGSGYGLKAYQLNSTIKMYRGYCFGTTADVHTN